MSLYTTLAGAIAGIIAGSLLVPVIGGAVA